MKRRLCFFIFCYIGGVSESRAMLKQRSLLFSRVYNAGVPHHATSNNYVYCAGQNRYYRLSGSLPLETLLCGASQGIVKALALKPDFKQMHELHMHLEKNFYRYLGTKYNHKDLKDLVLSFQPDRISEGALISRYATIVSNELKLTPDQWIDGLQAVQDPKVLQVFFDNLIQRYCGNDFLLKAYLDSQLHVEILPLYFKDLADEAAQKMNIKKPFSGLIAPLELLHFHAASYGNGIVCAKEFLKLDNYFEVVIPDLVAQLKYNRWYRTAILNAALMVGLISQETKNLYLNLLQEKVSACVTKAGFEPINVKILKEIYRELRFHQ